MPSSDFRPFCTELFPAVIKQEGHPDREYQGICHRPKGHEDNPDDTGHSEFPKEGDWPSKERMPASD